MRLFRSTLKHFGYGLVRLEYAKPSYGLDCLFPLLKQRGFEPRHILDVGANRGLWTTTAIEYFPDALYTLIEPQEELESHVQDLVERGFRIVWVNMGAADTSGSLPLTVSPRDDSGSFRFGDEQPDPAGCRRVLVTVRTLDEILSSLGAPIPDMVKIDAEGFGLRVLRGASGLLGKTEIFFCGGHSERQLGEQCVASGPADVGQRVFASRCDRSEPEPEVRVSVADGARVREEWGKASERAHVRIGVDNDS
jgi:FkbM family methyltransferase